MAPPTSDTTEPITYPDQNGHPEDYPEDNVIYVEVSKLDQFCQTDLEDENLTLVQWRLKYERPFPEEPTAEAVEPDLQESPPQSIEAQEPTKPVSPKHIEDIPIVLHPTTASLNQMETQFLAAELAAKTTRSPDHVPVVAPRSAVETPVKKIVPKYSSVLNRSVSAATSSASTNPPRIGSRSSGVRQTTSATGTRPAPSKLASGSGPPPSVGPRRIDMPKGVYPRVNAVRATMVSNQPPKRILLPNATPPPSAPPTRFGARSKTMIELPNNKHRHSAPQPRFKGLSREDIASSSSTLKASNEMVSASKSSLAGSRTHLQKIETTPPKAKDDSDGWLTVKVKRRSSLHWANRFNQPTGYASLPTLTLPCSNESSADTPKDAAKSNPKAITASKKENKKVSKPAGVPLPVNGVPRAKTVLALVNANRKVKTPSKEASVMVKPLVKAPIKPSPLSVDQRQKSDLTGLKLATLRREYMRTANRSKGSGKGHDSDNIQLVDNNMQTNLTTTLPIEQTKSNGTRDLSASSCDESEDRDEFESDEDQRKLLEEQESLERQIRELENTEIDVDTETDETDCETVLDDGSQMDYLSSAVNGLMIDNETMSLEMRYQLLLSDMSQGERTETLATLHAFVTRHPGRAQELHQKLSSPSRRRSLHQTLKMYQAKHARAQEKRDALNKEKAHKIQVLLARVEDVKAAKQQLIEDKRLRMEERLQRAAENRTQYLKDKIRKAHDEEEKMKEIVFIKNLEAQNKRLDFMESWKEQEGRLQDLEQERQKKLEEKAAKEAAVEKRRLELELERQRRLEKMNETR